MGELIPLFKKTNLRFELSAVQRLRFEDIRKELRLRRVEQVAELIVFILLTYFEKKREGWTLVMLHGGESSIVEIEVTSQKPPPPRLASRILMRIVMMLESLAGILRRLVGIRSEQHLYLLSGKEYTIRCSRNLYQKINRLLDYYREEGSPATIDRIMIQGTGLLTYYLNERRARKERQAEPVELVFEKREEGKAMSWLWDDYFSTFE